jgi:hypothetical protein
MATEDSKCTANLGSQDTLILNMLNIAVVWWLLPVLVKIWEKQSKSIPDGIMFSALQASQPGAAANFAIRAGRNHEERLFMFYNGIRTPENPETPAKVPWYMVLIHIIIDAGSVLYPVISLFAKRPDCDTVDSLPMLWFYPSLPGAVFGLWITLDAKILRLSQRWSLAGCWIAVSGVGLGFSIPIWLNYMGTGDTTMYYLPILAYFYMAIPAAIFIHCDLRGPLICVVCAALAVAARNGPVAYSAWKGIDDDSFKLPLPSWVDQRVLGGFYLGIGVICSLLSVSYFYVGGMKHQLKHLKKLRDEEHARKHAEKKMRKKMKKEKAAGSDSQDRIPGDLESTEENVTRVDVIIPPSKLDLNPES